MIPLIAADDSLGQILSVGQTALRGNITFTRASNATFFDSTGTLQTSSTNIARFDYDPLTLAWRGLLLEGARTNSIRNGNVTGATVGVIGSGGVAPTNWNNFGVFGLTREIVSIGTENGIPYVDIRVFGTSTGAGSFGSNFESGTQISATSGQTWSASCYLKVIAGSGNGISSSFFSLSERSATTFLVESQQAFSTTPITDNLSASRLTLSRTFNNASTLYAQCGFTLAIVFNQDIDITIRIGGIQLEQGAFASSYIPTTGTAATRAADSAINSVLASIGYSTSGTLLVEFEYPNVVGGGIERKVMQFDDGTTANQLSARLRALNGQVRMNVTNNSTAATNDTANSYSSGIARFAVAWTSDTASAVCCLSGGTVTAANIRPVPGSAFNRLILTPANEEPFGWLRRLTYYPTRLPNATLQALTA